MRKFATKWYTTLSIIVKPLSDNVLRARHDADVACSGCSASYNH